SRSAASSFQAPKSVNSRCK
ncbi:hypothetical protein PF008_g18919, partial [Phytophthora fragariae]